jgi:electron transfer flavoprotein beta subunit
MKILVCIKQVPGSNKVETDPKTGVIKRTGDAKMNPYDLFALESGLRLKEKYGGELNVITMGPPQAMAVIREAFGMGADEGAIVTDRKFGGADVLATAYTISQGIRSFVGIPDIIVCGLQTTDGDTAQVGPELSERLGIPSVCNVREIIEADDKSITVDMEMSTDIERVKIQFPCLITVQKDIVQPRLPSYKRMKATADKEIKSYTLKEMEDQDEKHYGLNGSPTQVQRIFPPTSDKEQVTWTGSSDELTGKIFDMLKKKKFVA